MKAFRTVLSVVVAFFLTIQGFAQTDNQTKATSIDFNRLGTYVPGKLFYQDGTVEEFKGIEYQNPEDLKKLDNVLHYNRPNQSARANINQAKLLAFEVGGNKWMRINHDGEEQFGIVHIEGAIKDYSVFKIKVVRVSGDYIEQRYIRKLDEEPISNGAFTMKYKKLIVTLVDDHPDMAKKIQAKEKGYKGFFNSEKVVKEYNEWHKTKYPEMYE